MQRPIPRPPASVGAPFTNSYKTMRCSICEKAVSIESAKADEYGRAIHEECYALKVRLKQATTPPAA
jgi:hypothetical protein